MRASRVLASPRVWVIIIGVAAVLALIYFAYLAAVASPEEYLKDLPVALVNEDEGARIAGEEVNLGERVVGSITAPDSPAAGTVRWARPDGREGALEGIGNNEYYGAIVIPADFSGQVSRIASPPTIPIALVDEDEGVEMNGRRVRLGEEVARRVSSPDSPAPPLVKWTRLSDRAAALDGLESGKFYAAIVLPKDYSQRLAGMSGLSVGGDSPAPQSAKIELLTSPAVRSSTTALIENVFSGMVARVSKTTSGRILAGLSEQGVPAPPGGVVSDPVKGTVSQADISGSAGPLPEVPEPAEIEVLTNPSAGPAASLPVQNISIGIVRAVSRAMSERITGAAAERGAQLSPEVAAVIGDPVRAEIRQAQPVGPNSGNGQAPFFLAFLANLSAFIGGAVIFFGTDGVAKDLEGRSLRPSRAGLWTVRLLLGLVYAALVAAVELGVAFAVVGVEHEASTIRVYLFLAVAIAATSTLTMLFATALGPAGVGVSAVLGVILGLVSSGGLAPLEALPPFYQAYAEWLPLRYVVDGLRSLLFYDGSLDAAGLEGGLHDALWFFGNDGRSETAGLEDAVWMLGVCLAGAAVLGYAVSLLGDLVARRSEPETEPVGAVRQRT